jgi:putative flippase GtrA
LDAGLLVVLTSGLHIWYLASAVCSYCCGILASYLLNRRFTFRNHNPRYLTQFATFAAISACCLIVHTALLWLLVELFALHYLTAKFVATAGVFCMNYAAQSRITFRAGGPGSLPQGAGK